MGDSWSWAKWLEGTYDMADDKDNIYGYMDQKMAERGYPGFPYKATSQADEIMRKANEPHMFFSKSATIPHAQVLDIAKQPAVWAEKLSPTSGRLEIENIPNEQAMRVALEVLPKIMELYLKKSRDYGGNVMQLMDLGPSACIPDMLRKFGKLKRAIWDGEEMVGEQPDEIIMDLAGHIFIILDEMWNK